MQIKQAWYRVSVKAIITNENGNFLLVKEDNGVWDFPGGGLDHGENPITCLKRELKEEMGLNVISVEEKPEYFITAHKPESETRPWIANVFYKVKVENLDFIPSEECIEIGFFNKKTVKEIDVLINVKEFFKNTKKLF